MTKIPKIFIEDPKSSNSDQDFTFLSKDIYSKYYSSEEESIKSLEKLLSKRKTIPTSEWEKEGITPNDVSKLVDQGKAIFSSLSRPAQLTLTF
jgi:hypothetical protein